MCSAGKVSKVAYVLCFAVSSIRPFLTSTLFISRFLPVVMFSSSSSIWNFLSFVHKVTVVVASLVFIALCKFYWELYSSHHISL